MNPKPNELYEEFIARCTSSGMSERECNIIFNKTITEVRFLSKVDEMLLAYQYQYTQKIAEILQAIYGDISDFISSRDTLDGWEHIIDTESLYDTLKELYGNVAWSTQLMYNDKYGDLTTSQRRSDMDRLAESFFTLRFLQYQNDIFRDTTVKIIRENIVPTVDETIENIGKIDVVSRAQRIASTEVGVIESYTEYETMKLIAGRRNIKKYWVGILDNVIRDSHLEATLAYSYENAIPFEDYFLINGNEILYPRDFNAPPEEVINCRCYLGYRN